MEVKIFRYNPEEDSSPYFDEYIVPIPHDGSHTAMDVLDYIYKNLDGSLSFYRHSVCNQGICGRCLAKLNGKVRFTCTYRVYEESLAIEPKNDKVIKDLIVE